jgi:hypothetical protein
MHIYSNAVHQPPDRTVQCPVQSLALSLDARHAFVIRYSVLLCEPGQKDSFRLKGYCQYFCGEDFYAQRWNGGVVLFIVCIADLPGDPQSPAEEIRTSHLWMHSNRKPVLQDLHIYIRVSRGA